MDYIYQCNFVVFCVRFGTIIESMAGEGLCMHVVCVDLVESVHVNEWVIYLKVSAI